MEAAGGLWQAAVIARASASPRAGHRARRASAASFTSTEDTATDAQVRLEFDPSDQLSSCQIWPERPLQRPCKAMLPAAAGGVSFDATTSSYS